MPTIISSKNFHWKGNTGTVDLNKIPWVEPGGPNIYVRSARTGVVKNFSYRNVMRDVSFGIIYWIYKDSSGGDTTLVLFDDDWN